MKCFQILFSLLIIAQFATAQKSGTIAYNETIKLDLEMDDMPGVDIKSMLPESTTFSRALYFNESATLYTDGEGEAPEDTEISSDDGSFKMVFKMDSDNEEILYTDLMNRTMVQQEGFMGKSFVINQDAPKYKWKITGEKIKFLDYECTKATTIHDEKSIVVWFAPQLPANIGPDEFGQLPGAVLMVSVDEGDTEIMATSVNLEKMDKEIVAPKDGKKVTKEEFEKIVEAKMKEMKEESGGERIMIRG